MWDTFSWFMERNTLPKHRRYLSQELREPVLDLGAGTGTMFPYFGAAAQRNGSLQLHAIEPNLQFKTRAEQKAERIGLDVSIRSGQAESLPYESESFNTIIASMVFCTIPDVEQALEEIHRVLKPDGELRFLDHVRSDGSYGQFQDKATPIWKRIFGGCHLNRRTETTLSNSPLNLTEIDEKGFDANLVPINKLIRGVARKGSAESLNSVGIER
jgi:ubiquinone/menaquinone biosynthesis C-methylase UbiE